MSLPDAARHTNTIAAGLWSERGDPYGGFSVPGIEITEARNSCCVEEGDVCRPRWVNRQDHGTLTRLNMARQGHGEYVPYCRDDRYLECEEHQLRTTAYGDGDFADDWGAQAREGAFMGRAGQRRRAVQDIFQRAQERRKTRFLTAKVQQLEMQTRRALAGAPQKEESIGVRYTPISGRSSLIE